MKMNLNNYLKKNLENLNENLFSFFDSIELKNYLISETNGFLTLFSKRKNWYLNSKYNPENEQKKIFSGLLKNYSPDDLIILYGVIFLPYVIKLLKENKIKNILIFEFNFELLKIFLSHYDISIFLKNKKIKIITALSIDKNINLDKNIIYFIHNKSLEEIPIEYIRLKELLNFMLLGKSTENKFKDMMINNYNINKKYFKDSILKLKNKFKNKTAVLIGASPFLDDKINYLAGLKKDDYIFMAVDNSSYVLEYLDVKEKYVITCDPQKYIKDYLMYLQDRDFILIHSAFAHFSVNDSDKRYYFIPYGHFLLNKLNLKIEKNDTIPASSSIAEYAYKFLQFSSVKKILLFGCDFCFDRYKVYSKASYSNFNWSKKTTKFNPIENCHINFMFNNELKKINDKYTHINLLNYKKEMDILTKK